MKNIDYNYICTLIGNFSGIPIRLYRDEEQIFFNSVVNLPRDPLLPYKNQVFAICEHVGYFVTPYFNCYGVVNRPPYKIIIGPSQQTAMSEKDIKELAFQCDVTPDDASDFISGIKGIVQTPISSVMLILCLMNYMLNGEKLLLKDIQIFDAEQQSLKQNIESARANQNFNDEISQIQSEQCAHNSLAIEQTLVNIVRKGDSNALSEWIANVPVVRGGMLATEHLRQLKNTFIVTATLVSRAAIQGGMDVEDSLSLSDAYIRKCELLNDVDRINNLQYHMVIDYTERVEKTRIGKSPSKLVVDISNYVQRHLSEPMDIEALAKAVFLSRNYLSAKFKQETGMTLSDFVIKEKIEEAKKLLRYTDKSLSAISSYLGFSSQSHFSRTFRQYADCSPGEYRKKYNS